MKQGEAIFWTGDNILLFWEPDISPMNWFSKVRFNLKMEEEQGNLE